MTANKLSRIIELLQWRAGLRSAPPPMSAAMRARIKRGGERAQPSDRLSNANVNQDRDILLRLNRNEIVAWVIDCETTGLSDSDRIVKFAAIQLKGGWPTGVALHLIFNPQIKSHPLAERVHGYKQSMLQEQQLFCEYAQDIYDMLSDGDVIVSHNIGFDISFLNRELLRSGIYNIRSKLYCTMLNWADRYNSSWPKLDYCARVLGISRRSNHHNALEDAFIAAEIYNYLVFGRRLQFDVDDDFEPHNMVR